MRLNLYIDRMSGDPKLAQGPLVEFDLVCTLPLRTFKVGPGPMPGVGFGPRLSS